MRTSPPEGSGKPLNLKKRDEKYRSCDWKRPISFCSIVPTVTTSISHKVDQKNKFKLESLLGKSMMFVMIFIEKILSTIRQKNMTYINFSEILMKRLKKIPLEVTQNIRMIFFKHDLCHKKNPQKLRLYVYKKEEHYELFPCFIKI